MPVFDYKERVAIYLRKSRMDDETESIDETLARHKDTLLKLAAKMNLNIVEIYKEVVSGDGLFIRPEMVRLLHDVEQDKYSAICCIAIDRLGRGSSKEAGIILETLQEHNVFIVTPDKVYDLHNDIDETSLEMQTFIARQELKSIKRRLRKGVEKSVEFGYHVGDIPYGYRRTYLDKHPTLEICEEEANAVRMVFDMYVNQGLGGQIIADKLNSMGYKPRKSNKFSRTTVLFYLQNPIYVGKIVWNKRRHLKKKSPCDKHRSMLNDSKDWIVSDGIHPAIISQELFDRAQQIRHSNAHPPTFTGELRNPFAGIIYCRNCGSAIQRQFSQKGGNRLLCPTSGCTRSINTGYVERYLLDFIKQALAECEATIKDNQNSERYQRSKLLKETIRTLKIKLAALNEQKSHLHDLLEQKVYDVSTFLERSNILSQKTQEIEKSLLEKKKELERVDTVPLISSIIPKMKHLLEHYEDLSVAEKNCLYKQIIRRVTYAHTKEQSRNECTLEIELQYEL